VRHLWDNLEAGERPSWDNGKINSQAYQTGFDVAENVIFEDGIFRKRLGVHSITLKNDLNAHTPSGDPFTPGYGPFAWDKTGYYFFNGAGTRAIGHDYLYTPVTFAPGVVTGSWAWNNLVAYQSSGAVDQVLIYDPTGSSVVTGKGEFTVESAGRRFFIRQLPANVKKVEVNGSRAGDLENFTFQDGNSGLTTLYPSDPIDLDLSGIGKILWVSEGFGLFFGTDRGIYELVNGLGMGFSPANGGFFPNSLGNYAVMPITHTASKARNQCVTMTQESVVFTSDVDTITVFNRKAKAAQQLKIDVPTTHAIDSMAWLGGPHVAVLLADISARASWGANGYNAASNIIVIVNEVNGVVSRFTGLSPFTIAGCGGDGLIFKASNGTTVKAGAIPYRSLERYSSNPTAFDPATFYDYTSTPYTARVLTMPLNGGSDIGDERRVSRVRLRVANTRSVTVKQITPQIDPETDPVSVTWINPEGAPSLFTGDVDFTIDTYMAPYVQIEISDSSSYPLEVLAIQLDLEINQDSGGQE